MSVVVADRPYRSLTKAEKEAEVYGRLREPAVACARCEVQVMPSDMPRHLESACPGRREPHPLDRWLTWAGAMGLGVAKATMYRWIRAGEIQVRMVSGTRRYLERDIVKLMSRQIPRFPHGTNGRKRKR